LCNCDELPDEGWLRIDLGVSWAPLTALLVGIDPSLGWPGEYREIGVDSDGNVVHRCPDERFGGEGRYGLFDPHNPPVSEGTPITREQFEEAWAREPALSPRARHWWQRQVGSTRSRPHR
jgi:hypothetical protein